MAKAKKKGTKKGKLQTMKALEKGPASKRTRKRSEESLEEGPPKDYVDEDVSTYPLGDEYDDENI